MKQHSEAQRKALKDQAESLYQAFLTLRTPAEVRQFLLDLCTPSEVEAMVDRDELRTRRLREGVLAHFDDRAWHRPRPAVSTGWRLMVRAIRGLRGEQRRSGREAFASIRNDYRPTTPEEVLRFAPYRS